MSIFKIPSTTVKPPAGKLAAKFLGSNITSSKSNIKEQIDFNKFKEGLLKDRVKPQKLPAITVFDQDGKPVKNDDGFKTLPAITVFDKDGKPVKNDNGFKTLPAITVFDEDGNIIKSDKGELNPL